MGDATLFRSGRIVASAGADADLPADLLVVDGRIERIAPQITVDPAACRIVELDGAFVLPGLVDTHRHLWQSLFRYAGADWTIMDYRNALWHLLGPRYTTEDMYLALRLGLAEAAEDGITQVFDWNHNLLTPEHADAAVQAHRDSGLRVVLGYGQSSVVWAAAQDPAVRASVAPPSLDLRRVQAQHYSASDRLLTLAVAARGPEVSPMDVVTAEADLARELGLRSSVHVGSGPRGARRAISLMHDAGLLSSDFTWVHCNTLADDQLELIAETGGTASCSPECEMHMGHGPPALRRLLRVGVVPSLSIDTCVNVGGDMFTAMRSALAVVRAEVHAEVLAAAADPEGVPLTTREVFDFATLQGARANGLDDLSGTLEEGKAADLTVIDHDSANLTPAGSAIASIVMGAHPGNVSHVMVAGQFVKDPSTRTSPELASLRRRARSRQAALLEEAGIDARDWVAPKIHLGAADVA